MYEEIKTVCLYVRYSSTNQTEQSIEGQIRVCQEFCTRHNFKITEIYADRATSASKDIEKRLEFLRMIDDAEKHRFDAVIVYKLDRFSRSRYDMATYKYKLKRNGVQLISATENITQDPEGIILESVLEGMAEFYSAELAQKITRGLRESAYKHNYYGGHVPLGYKLVDKKFVIDETTAPAVVEAFQKYADGFTVAQIARDLNEKGFRTSKGTKFGRSSFSKFFTNELYIGTYTFHDYKAENAIPAIIDKELWEKVQMRKNSTPKQQPGTYKAKRTYLLSGKLFCGHCGSKINGDSGGNNKTEYYQCWGRKNVAKGCTKKAVRKEVIEKAVVQDALSLLTDETIESIAETAIKLNNRELETTTNIPAIKAHLKEIDTSLTNLMKAIETGNSPEILVKRISELEREKRIQEEQLKQEEKQIIYLDKPKVIYWLESFRDGDINDPEYQKQIIDTFINSVTVYDEPDNTTKITIIYNLTQNQKTYHLTKDDTSIRFSTPTSSLEYKSDKNIIIHHIRIWHKPHHELLFLDRN